MFNHVGASVDQITQSVAVNRTIIDDSGYIFDNVSDFASDGM